MSNQVKKWFWLSWWWPDKLGDFTLYCPWWISCENGDGDQSVCAAIPAASAAEARLVVVNAYDYPPQVTGIDWRFCEERYDDPFSSDRFPRAKWMKWPPKKRTEKKP